MHKIEIAQHAIDRAMARRGRVAVYDAIEPAKTALLVVDLQNCFMKEGMPAEIDHARDIVPNVNRLAAATRAAGGAVFWIRNTFSEETLTTWANWSGWFMTPELRERMIAEMSRGSEGHAIWPLLDVKPEDAQVEKRRFSALIQGASDLEAQLRKTGVDTVIVVGTASHVCCESTARDAMMLGFKTFFATDANAAPTDADHNATLSALIQSFCDVRPTAEIVALFEAGALAREAAA
jgi:ureidoacrylate peracid hydrolase